MIDLTKFCHPKRDDISAPWSDREHSYATNGVMVVRVPRRDAVPPQQPSSERLSDAVERYLIGLSSTGDGTPFSSWIAVSHLDIGEKIPLPPNPCQTCAGSGVVIETQCERCDGKGFRACGECGNDCDCQGCNGYGSTSSPAKSGDPSAVMCDDCEGDGDLSIAKENTTPQAVRIGPYIFDRSLVLLLRELPGLRLDAGAEAWWMNPDTQRYGDGVDPFMPMPVRFTFDGGVGAALPLRGKYDELSRIATSKEN